MEEREIAVKRTIVRPTKLPDFNAKAAPVKLNTAAII